MTPYPIVEIEWLDASYDGSISKPDQLEPLVILHNVGYLVREDKTSVSLAMEAHVVDGTIRHTVHIPKSCIKSRRKLKG